MSLLTWITSNSWVSIVIRQAYTSRTVNSIFTSGIASAASDSACIYTVSLVAYVIGRTIYMLVTFGSDLDYNMR